MSFFLPDGPWAPLRRAVKRNTARHKGRDGGHSLVAEEELGECRHRCPPVHTDACLELSAPFPVLSPAVFVCANSSWGDAAAHGGWWECSFLL